MLSAVREALKVKDIRKRLMYTFMMLVIIRIGSQIPLPGVNTSFFKDKFSGVDTFNFFNAMTGGSFENMSIFALSITPYINSSIIIQLLTIAIPKLEEMQRDGEEGRRKLTAITRYVTVALALIQASAFAIGFGRQGLLINYNWHNVLLSIVAMTAGSAFLMWIGERITEKGVGNGISIVLLINILSRLPVDLGVIVERYILHKSIAMGVLATVVTVAVIVIIIGFVVLLNDAERHIPVQYSQKMAGRRMVGGRGSHIPLKVNTGGVMPVIFASSLMSFPVIIAEFTGVDYSTLWGKILAGLSSHNWLDPKRIQYSWGLVLYILLIFAFAYFYTNISFNPLEVANNMKKQGGFIPGIRPGKPTSDYLNGILKYVVFIGAIGLTGVCMIPIIFSGVFNLRSLSFGGTSLIIIVGVILETLKQIESLMVVRSYKGFLTK